MVVLESFSRFRFDVVTKQRAKTPRHRQTVRQTTASAECVKHRISRGKVLCLVRCHLSLIKHAIYGAVNSILLWRSMRRAGAEQASAHSSIHAPKPSKRAIRPAEERASRERRASDSSRFSVANRLCCSWVFADASGNHAKSSHPQTPQRVFSETRNLASPVMTGAAANLLCHSR
jgi:hypothetical protein